MKMESLMWMILKQTFQSSLRSLSQNIKVFTAAGLFCAHNPYVHLSLDPLFTQDKGPA